MNLPSSKPAVRVPAKQNYGKYVLSTLALIGILGAGVYLFIFWRQWSSPGEHHYNKGMEYADQRRFHDAEREWELGTREDLQSPLCFEGLGNLYTELQRYPAALIAYQRAVKLSPSDGHLLVELAQTQQRLGRIREAEASAREAARLLPRDAEAVGLYGLLATRQKDSVALSVLSRAHELEPDSAAFLIPLAYAKMDRGDMSGAEHDLDIFLKTHPDMTVACYQMAVIYNQKPPSRDNVRQGLAFANRALAGMRGDPRIYSLLGMLYLNSNQPEQALRVFTAAQRFGTSESVVHGLLDASRQLGHVKEAEAYAAALQVITARHDRISHLKHVMGFNHNDVTSGLELAELEEQDGNRKQAITYFVQLVRQSPKDPRTRPALAREMNRAGSPDLAKRALDLHFAP